MSFVSSKCLLPFLLLLNIDSYRIFNLPWLFRSFYSLPKIRKYKYEDWTQIPSWCHYNMFWEIDHTSQVSWLELGSFRMDASEEYSLSFRFQSPEPKNFYKNNKMLVTPFNRSHYHISMVWSWPSIHQMITAWAPTSAVSQKPLLRTA